MLGQYIILGEFSTEFKQYIHFLKIFAKITMLG